MLNFLIMTALCGHPLPDPPLLIHHIDQRCHHHGAHQQLPSVDIFKDTFSGVMDIEIPLGIRDCYLLQTYLIGSGLTQLLGAYCTAFS